MSEFEVFHHKIGVQMHVGTTQADIWIQFGVKGPNGEHSLALTYVWPSGNSQTVETVVPFKNGGLTIDTSITLDDIRSGDYILRLKIAGEDLGDFPFTID